MSKVKRTIAFTMAMIICVSFCLINSYAAYAPIPFSGPTTYGYFESGNSSFCFVSVSDYGDTSYTTDLEASTQGYNQDYYDNPTYNETTMVAFALLTLYFSDGTNESTSSSYNAGADEPMARIRLFGKNLMPGDESIVDLTSQHYVQMTTYTYDESSEDPSIPIVNSYYLGDKIIVISTK